MHEQLAPFGSPPCWGKQYDDADKECNQCEFKHSCMPVVLNNVANTEVKMPPYGQQNNIVSGPWKPAHTPITPVFAPPPTAPVYAPPVAYQQPIYAAAPAPQQPWIPQQQPQAPQQALQQQMMPYQYPVYDGESEGVRLMKNITKAMGAAACDQLGTFFRYWPWPPRG